MQKLATSILAGGIVWLQPRCFEPFWLGEPVNRAVIIATARLSDNVDDTALRLAVLRLESCGLYLYFFDERGIDAGAERAKDTRERANAAEGRISNVNAVGNIQVIKRGPTRD